MSAALHRHAVAVAAGCDRTEEVWVDARTAERARHHLFEHICTTTADPESADGTTLQQTLIDSKLPPELEVRFAR